MDKILDKANLLWGAAVTVLSAVFGQFWYLFAAFLALNIIDYITGLMATSYRSEDINSYKSIRGL